MTVSPTASRAAAQLDGAVHRRLCHHGQRDGRWLRLYARPALAHHRVLPGAPGRRRHLPIGGVICLAGTTVWMRDKHAPRGWRKLRSESLRL